LVPEGGLAEARVAFFSAELAHASGDSFRKGELSAAVGTGHVDGGSVIVNGVESFTDLIEVSVGELLLLVEALGDASEGPDFPAGKTADFEGTPDLGGGVDEGVD